MGQLQTYVCTNCHYSAEASDKTEVTMLAVLQPYVCNNCQALVMVEVGEYGDTNKPDAERACPQCGSASIKIWQPRKRPCPKCKSGKMEIGENGAAVFID